MSADTTSADATQADSVKITKSFVKQHAPYYSITALEERLFRKDGTKAKKNGVLGRKALLRLGQWRSITTLNRLENTPPHDIKFITTVALDKHTPDHFRSGILQLLPGVGAPLASCILSITKPKKFAILDARVAGVLHSAGHLSAKQPTRIDYAEYLQVMRSLAKACDTDLLTLYRALWAYGNSSGLPTTTH